MEDMKELSKLCQRCSKNEDCPYLRRGAKGVTKCSSFDGFGDEFIEFMGASRVASEEDEKLWDYKPRGSIYINVDLIAAFYENTIIIDNHKIRVMETLDEIREAIRNARGE